MKKPEANELWHNNRRGTLYHVIAIAQDADADTAREMVVYMDTEIGKCFVRSMESWQGTNRDGYPRFVFFMKVLP